MRNMHQRTGANNPLTVNLAANTGLWVQVKDGITLRIEAASDGSVNVYLSKFGDNAFHIEHLKPDVLNLSAEA